MNSRARSDSGPMSGRRAWTWLGLIVVLGISVPSQAHAADAITEATIAGYQYQPNSFEVHTGDTVTWTNEDRAPHSVTTSSGPARLDSPDLSKGQSWTYTFTEPGTYRYYCAVHPSMRAVVVVAAASNEPAGASAAAGGPVGSSQQTRAAFTPRAAVAAEAHPVSADAAPGAGAGSAVPLITTTTTTTPGGVHINPLLFLLAVVVGVVVFSLLSLASTQPNEVSTRQ